jgi:hypothetical protein
MRVRVVATLALLLASQILAAAPARKLFDVSLEDIPGGSRVLNVGFYGKLPPPSVVDKILRESLEHAILVDPRVDILATGFLGEDVLSSNQYSGSLVYKASQKRIVTFDEYHGVQTSTSSTASYFVEVQEDKTLAGIKPEKKWLSVTIVFSPQPTRDAAYNAIAAETQKLAARGLDINVYVSVGNPKIKTSWMQMKDKDGAYVFAEYDAASKRITRKGQLLKQLP